MALGYFPPVDWFVAFTNHDAILEMHEHYAKGSYRNRCQILTASGPQKLTIPLRKGKNEQQPIKDVRIAYDESWQIKHWRSICTAYGNSPFFEHYVDKFRPFYLERQFEFLWDWNIELLSLTLKLLKLERPLKISLQFEHLPKDAIDLRGLIDGQRSQQIDDQVIRYPQVFEDRLGFLPNQSILDLLFCAGRLSKYKGF